MGRAALLSVLAGGVVAANWLRLEDPAGAGRPAALVVIAVAAAFVRPAWLRAVGLAAAALGAIWIALSVPPSALWPGEKGFFGPIGSRFGDGFLQFYDYRLPVDPATRPLMHGVLLYAIFGFTLAVALAVATRRPLLAVGAFLLGAGWPATLLTGGNELGRGAVVLAVALTLLAGLSGRQGRLALPAVIAVVVGALVLSSSPAVAKSAFLNWRTWDFHHPAQKPVSVSYVWDANYDGLAFPKKVTTVLRIRAPRAPLYWRATVLERFSGDRWLERPWLETAEESHAIVPEAARHGDNAIKQDVTVEALRDRHVVGGSIPIDFNIAEPAKYVGQGVAVTLDGLRRGQQYTVWSYAGAPTPAVLARSRPVYPVALTRPGRELDLSPGRPVPPFGAPGRELQVARLLARRLSPYEAVFDRARAVAGRTPSPYAATVALETWFRSTGGFSYSAHPPRSSGLPPLVGFVIDSKVGYCQHFAGAMALMLRLLGIPSRVVAGFVSGSYRQGEWRVTDHDAHTWVEAWFRGYGWLPFDPTPGRGRLAGAYSSTSRAFDRAAAARLLGGLVRGGEVFGPGAPDRLTEDPQRRTPRSAGDAPGPTAAVAVPPQRGPSLFRFLLLLASGLLGMVLLAKQVRRRLRYTTRDPRRIAAASGRELSDFLLDQRVPVARGATLRELASIVADRFAVDAGAFTEAASAARFGPPGGAGASAQRARRELRELKRTLRRRLDLLDRARGAVSLRSLGFS